MIYPVPKPPVKRKPKKPLRARSRSKRVPPPMAGKPTRVRDEAHLERIRDMRCACLGIDPTAECGGWGMTGRCEASHVTNRSWGGGDDEVIPLCPAHHRKCAYSWHVLGRARFGLRYGFSAAKLARALYDETLKSRGLATP